MLHAVIGSFTDFDFVVPSLNKKITLDNLDKLLHTKHNFVPRMILISPNFFKLKSVTYTAAAQLATSGSLEIRGI